MSVTMKDIARIVGVSTTTVSHAINNTRPVEPVTKQRILKVMEEYGYNPNVVARSLRSGTTRTIGIIVSDITNPFFTEIVRSCEDTAYRHGYNTILCNSDENPHKERVYIDVLRQRQIDGLIIAPTTENREYLQRQLWDRVPLVFIDRYLEDIFADSVIWDDERAAFEAVSHLLELGHRRIGIITGKAVLSSTEKRLRGYLRALKSQGVEHDPRLMAIGDYKYEGGYQAMKQLLKQNRRFTAVFAVNNMMTLGVLGALKDEGLTCPGDISVVGVGDFEWTALYTPPLTVCAQPTRVMGERAVELLLERMRDKRSGPKQVVLSMELKVRESTKRIEKT